MASRTLAEEVKKANAREVLEVAIQMRDIKGLQAALRQGEKCLEADELALAQHTLAEAKSRKSARELLESVVSSNAKVDALQAAIHEGERVGLEEWEDEEAKLALAKEEEEA